MGKVGLDGHDRGAKVVMSALRDAGMEVIYSGLHQSPSAVARAAVDEDVDVVGLSILSGAHNQLVPKVLEALKKEGLEGLPLIIGGIIPDGDIDKLKSLGVGEVFTPGTRMEDITSRVENLAKSYRKKQAE